MKALADTSIWIAGEMGRPIDWNSLPDELFVCVVTVAELEAGVLAASDISTRARRLTTLNAVNELAPLPADVSAARQWALLRVKLREANRRVNVNDLWIAAIALANDLPVVTQDDDFGVLSDLGMLDVVQV